MSNKIVVVVCEVQKPPYRAEMTIEQVKTLIHDYVEVIRPSVQAAWGNECPLPDSVALLAGGNAAVKDVRPRRNRFGILGNFVISGARGHSIRRDLIEKIIEAVQKYDSEVASHSIIVPPQAIAADVWEKSGKEWSPDAHLTGDTRRADEIRFVNYLLQKHGNVIAAFHLYRPLPVMYSLELQFADSAEGRQQARSFLHEYQGAFDAKDQLRAAASAAADAFLEKVQVRP